jgi:putative restriction endonuclease
MKGGESLLRQFDALNVWSRGDQRAPHKPLLVLYALGRWSRGDTDDIPFRDVDRDLTALLKEFGPSRQSHHPEYPFWRLQNDGVWAVHASAPLKARRGNTDARKSDLLAHEATGGFTEQVKDALRARPALVGEIAGRLLESHFPESLHPDILAAVGLDPVAAVAPDRRRDPQFRSRVLTAYEYRCAVCGFDVRLGSVSIALDGNRREGENQLQRRARARRRHGTAPRLRQHDAGGLRLGVVAQGFSDRKIILAWPLRGR